jgi:hypothetical protein
MLGCEGARNGRIRRIYGFARPGRYNRGNPNKERLTMRQHMTPFRREAWKGPRPAWTYRYARRPKRMANLVLKARRLELGMTRREFDRYVGEMQHFVRALQERNAA